MRHLFIDTNVYLSFFRLPSDDLEELKKLAAVLQQNDLQLYVTEQVRDEFRRRREDVLADSLRLASEAKLPTQFPQILRNYSLFQKVDEARKAFAQHISKLNEQVGDAAMEGSLHADKLLRELLRQATELGLTDDVVQAAKERVGRGNPPGKAGSYGDALNWEAILAAHPVGKDLDLITGDRDYLSPLNPHRLHEFLAHEWSCKKASEVHVYPNMTRFFQAHYRHIQLSEDAEAEIAVRRLVESENFLATHAAVARLTDIVEFSERHVRTLADAAFTNTQVRWIIQDEDVEQFYRRLLEQYPDALDDNVRNELQRLLDEGE